MVLRVQELALQYWAIDGPFLTVRGEILDRTVEVITLRLLDPVSEVLLDGCSGDYQVAPDGRLDIRMDVPKASLLDRKQFVVELTDYGSHCALYRGLYSV